MTKRFSTEPTAPLGLHAPSGGLRPDWPATARPRGVRRDPGAFRISVNFLIDEGFQDVPVAHGGLTGRTAEQRPVHRPAPSFWGGPGDGRFRPRP
jgi:hypothetical protein